MNKVVKILKFVLVLLSLSSLVIVFFPTQTYKEFWSIAWYLLIIVMFLRPIRDIFKKCKILNFLSKFRRELWILVWVFWIAHGIWAFMFYKWLVWDTKTYFQIFIEPYVWNYTWYMFWWMLAWIVAIPLLITSNWLATSILWSKWKLLQRFSYLMFVLAWIHIYLIEKEIWVLIIIWVWFLIWIISFILNRKSKKITLSDWPKWYCVPCGYIYDENIWDSDSWIIPWTKFEDIPDDWRCPVCGVWKTDFILLENDITYSEAIITWVKYLTIDVIELKIELKKQENYKKWQFITFWFEDEKWKFNRSYSIANSFWKIFTFLIKIKETWRAWKMFKILKEWDAILYSNISWNFTLKNTKNPKIFIATWTWLSPIYNMLLQLEWDIKKKLFFWAQTLKDLFYLEELNKIPNLETNIYLSKEESKSYNFWRINLSNMSFDIESEFYICGNPWLVRESVDTLKNMWFKNIYFEEFN